MEFIKSKLRQKLPSAGPSVDLTDKRSVLRSMQTLGSDVHAELDAMNKLISGAHKALQKKVNELFSASVDGFT